MLTVTVVIPAYNAERTLGKVLDALSAQTQPVDEVIVVDDGSTDGTAEIAVRHGAVAVHTDGSGFAGAARNRGWEAASGDVVVFLDSDAIPGDGWGAGLRRALAEFPGAIVGCARTFRGKTPWGWVAHLQSETPYLPRGGPRTVAFVSSYCMAVPRAAPLRWDPSYGGEDGIFCADAIGAGMELVFDPRYQAFHDHDRSTFAALRGQQRRLAYGLARIGPVQREGLHKRVLSRLPVHYFALVRLLPIYRRIRRSPELRDPFSATCPASSRPNGRSGRALRYASDVRRSAARLPEASADGPERTARPERRHGRPRRKGSGSARLRDDAAHRPRDLGPPPDRDEALRVLRRAVDLGVDFIDTADAYGPDVRAPRRRGAPPVSGRPRRYEGRPAPAWAGRWSKDGRPEHLKAACEEVSGV